MRRILLTLMLLAWAMPASAQVVFDACSQGETTATSLTYSHTVAAGSNRVLYVSVAVDAAANFNPTVTYAGVSMTDLGVEVTTNRYLTVFRLVAPATGANNVVISSLPGGGDEASFACSFSGVDQTTPEDAPVTTNGNLGTTSVTVATATNDMIWDTVTANTPTTLTPGGSQTLPANGSITDASSAHATSYRTGNGSLAMDWTLGSAQTNAQIGLNINAAAGAGGGCTGGLLLLGAGKCE